MKLHRGIVFFLSGKHASLRPTSETGVSLSKAKSFRYVLCPSLACCRFASPPSLAHALNATYSSFAPYSGDPPVCTGVLRLCLCRGGLKVSSAFRIYPGICYAYFEGYSETTMIGLPHAGIPAWLEGSRRLTGALPTHVYAPSYATHINFGFCFFPS